MGLINYQNIDNSAPATANIFNTRFGQIVAELNGNIDSSNLKNGAVTLAKVAAEVYSAMWPIGSIYFNATDNTNPGTLLGFGTWQAFGAGRVPVGVAGSGTFATAGTQVGEEQHTLSWNEMPVHNHGINDPGHGHGVSYSGGVQPAFTTGGGNMRFATSGSGQQMALGSININGSGTGISTQNAGGGAGHNVIQPSITVYMWQRVS